MTGPQVSAWYGTARNCTTRPRSAPSTGTRNKPSALEIDPGAPSVAIHRFTTESKVRLSGQEIGATGPCQPPKYLPDSSESPQTKNRFQPKDVALARLAARDLDDMPVPIASAWIRAIRAGPSVGTPIRVVGAGDISTRTFAPSWVNRPSAVCLTGVDCGSRGSISTM